MRHIGIVVALAAFFGAMGVSDASIVTIDATQDAFVQNGSSYVNKNFGGDALLMGKSQAGTQLSRKAYIGFNLSDFPITPAGSYMLTLEAVEGFGTGIVQPTNTFRVYGLPAGTSWVEGTGIWSGGNASGITWNTAPVNDKTSGYAMGAGAQLLGTFDLVGKGIGTTINFQSAAMDSFINDNFTGFSDTLMTFVITRETVSEGYVHAFASMESTTSAGPQLAALPEPTTLGIWAVLGTLGIAFSRRRK